MERFRKNPAGSLRAVAVIAVAVAGVICLRRFVIPAIRISAQAAGAALVISPLCRLFEKKFSRGCSAVMSVTCAFVIAAAAVATIPIAISGFAADMPAIIASLKSAANWISGAVNSIGMDMSGAADSIASWTANAVSGAVNAIRGAVSSLAGLAVVAVLSGFILRDRDRLLLHIELIVPLAYRQRVVRCACAVYADIMLYFRAQLIISLCVGLLSALGLTVIGVPQSLTLGLMAGVFNIIPYLGPIIAAIPVAISALSCGLPCAAMAIIIMIAVQQIDGLIISPRVMGSVTGFSSAAVMIGVYCAGAAAGIPGMLLILPSMILIRTCMRVFVESDRSD